VSQNSPFVRQARYPTLPLSTNPKSSGAPSFALLRRVGCKPFAPRFSLNRPQNYGCPTSRFSDVRKYTFPASSCRRPLSLPVLSSLLITRCSLLVHKNAFAFTYPQPTHPALIPPSSPFLFLARCSLLVIRYSLLVHKSPSPGTHPEPSHGANVRGTDASQRTYIGVHRNHRPGGQSITNIFDNPSKSYLINPYL
jgi:hypothetical protein